MRSDVIVGIDEVPADAVLLDVRWTLGGTPGDGKAAFLAGHIPGARFLDFETVLAGPLVDPTLGRHPLPDAARLADGLGALGVNGTAPVIVYDVPGSFAANRAWWVLTWAGLDARVLDGGITAWTSSGRPLEVGEPAAATPASLTLTIGHLPTITADEASAWGGTLIDARAPERYSGQVEPIDPVAGHIPGAVNRPVSNFWDADGRLPDDDQLRDLLGELSDPVAVYCGSGVSATQVILALAALGRPTSLYAPSWSGWSADPARPVATGLTP